MHAYLRTGKELVCKYTATTRKAMPIMMPAAIGSASRELPKHPSNEIHVDFDFHNKDIMATVSSV